MKLVRKLVEVGLAERKKENIKVRQPLRKIIFNIQCLMSNDLIQLIKDELNIKNIEFNKDQEQPAVLDIDLDSELIAEGKLRELIHVMFKMPVKPQGLDSISIFLLELPELPELLLELKRQVLADQVVMGPALKVELVK